MKQPTNQTKSQQSSQLATQSINQPSNQPTKQSSNNFPAVIPDAERSGLSPIVCFYVSLFCFLGSFFACLLAFVSLFRFVCLCVCLFVCLFVCCVCLSVCVFVCSCFSQPLCFLGAQPSLLSHGAGARKHSALQDGPVQILPYGSLYPR